MTNPFRQSCGARPAFTSLASKSMTIPSGCAATPPAKKLGPKDGQSAALTGLPGTLSWLSGERVFCSVETPGTTDARATQDLDYLHLFADSAAAIDTATPPLHEHITQDGIIWINQPQKGSKVPIDVTEDTIRKQLRT